MPACRREDSPRRWRISLRSIARCSTSARDSSSSGARAGSASAAVNRWARIRRARPRALGRRSFSRWVRPSAHGAGRRPSLRPARSPASRPRAQPAGSRRAPVRPGFQRRPSAVGDRRGAVLGASRAVAEEARPLRRFDQPGADLGDAVAGPVPASARVRRVRPSWLCLPRFSKTCLVVRCSGTTFFLTCAGPITDLDAGVFGDLFLPAGELAEVRFGGDRPRAGSRRRG